VIQFTWSEVKTRLKAFASFVLWRTAVCAGQKDLITAVTARANLLGISDKTGDKVGTLEVAHAQT
jgi:hypothetical protein